MDTKDQAQTKALETAILTVEDLTRSASTPTEIDVTAPHDICTNPEATESEKRSAQFSTLQDLSYALGDFFAPANIYSALPGANVGISAYPQPVQAARIALRVAVAHGRKASHIPVYARFAEVIESQDAFNEFLDSVQVRIGVQINTNFHSDVFPTGDHPPERLRGDIVLRVRARIAPSR